MDELNLDKQSRNPVNNMAASIDNISKANKNIVPPLMRSHKKTYTCFRKFTYSCLKIDQLLFYRQYLINPLTDNTILDWFKLKQIADDNFKVHEK